MSLQNLSPASYNLIDATSTLSPALRNNNFKYGPTYVLMAGADTFASVDNAALELAFGPSYMSSIDFIWKYDQF